MKNLLLYVLVLLCLDGLASKAPAVERPPAPALTPHTIATVTYTPNDPNIAPWVDSGEIVYDHQETSPFFGYTIRSIFFTDHANGYHLDEGTVDVSYAIVFL